MKIITDPQKCTGCQACRLICPTQCLAFVPDDEGFLVPQIDQALCIDCQKCARGCPENAAPRTPGPEPVRVLAARLRDDALLRQSASGGCFAGLAARVLETEGSAVFGCAYDEQLTACHVRVTDKNALTPLQGSKYVQSDVGDSYAEARALLEDGKAVLYSGTPCQIGGLYAYLGRDYDRLLTADLICHGVPSPLLFRRYLELLARRHGEPVTGYSFRDKQKKGWAVMIRYQTRRKNRSVEPWLDPYLVGFLTNRTFREGCYTCRYAGSRRVADFTLGDYWGIESAHPAFFDARGVSVLLVNSPKGERFLAEAGDLFETVESTLPKVLPRNHNLCAPSPRSPLRDSAYRGIDGDCAELFRGPAYRTDAKTKARALLKQWLPQRLLRLYAALKAR